MQGLGKGEQVIILGCGGGGEFDRVTPGVGDDYSKLKRRRVLALSFGCIVSVTMTSLDTSHVAE